MNFSARQLHLYAPRPSFTFITILKNFSLSVSETKYDALGISNAFAYPVFYRQLFKRVFYKKITSFILVIFTFTTILSSRQNNGEEQNTDWAFIDFHDEILAYKTAVKTLAQSLSGKNVESVISSSLYITFDNLNNRFGRSAFKAERPFLSLLPYILS